MVVVRLERGLAEARVRRRTGAVAAVRVRRRRDDVGRRVERRRPHRRAGRVQVAGRAQRVLRLVAFCIEFFLSVHCCREFAYGCGLWHLFESGQVVDQVGQSAEQQVRVERVVLDLQRRQQQLRQPVPELGERPLLAAAAAAHHLLDRQLLFPTQSRGKGDDDFISQFRTGYNQPRPVGIVKLIGDTNKAEASSETR